MNGGRQYYNKILKNNKVGSLLYTIYTKNLKMDHRPNYRS